jgi:hypothetical protein
MFRRASHDRPCLESRLSGDSGREHEAALPRLAGRRTIR